VRFQKCEMPRSAMEDVVVAAGEEYSGAHQKLFHGWRDIAAFRMREQFGIYAKRTKKQ